SAFSADSSRGQKRFAPLRAAHILSKLRLLIAQSADMPSEHDAAGAADLAAALIDMSRDLVDQGMRRPHVVEAAKVLLQRLQPPLQGPYFAIVEQIPQEFDGIPQFLQRNPQLVPLLQ